MHAEAFVVDIYGKFFYAPGGFHCAFLFFRTATMIVTQDLNHKSHEYLLDKLKLGCSVCLSDILHFFVG